MLLFKQRAIILCNQEKCRKKLKLFGHQHAAYNQVLIAVMTAKHNDQVLILPCTSGRSLVQNELEKKIEDFTYALKLWRDGGFRIDYLYFAVVKAWEMFDDVKNNPEALEAFVEVGELGRLILVAKNISDFFYALDTSPENNIYKPTAKNHPKKS